MKASETNLRSILEGNKQFLVPLFQRTYSWDKKEWETLWIDLDELFDEDERRKHFIGSTVTIPQDSAASGVTKYLLIDGQQRLTTLLILLALLRDRAKDIPDSSLSAEIHDSFLVNRHKKGADYWKLLPTQADREPYHQIMKGELPSQQTQMGKAATFFAKVLTGKQPAALEELQQIITDRLMLVDIKLDYNEDPYLIFESLNAKGRPLTQADLIRNYFFMKIPDESQQLRAYDLHWEPMQIKLGPDLPEGIRHFLMREGISIRQSDTYLALKRRVESDVTTDPVQRLAELARFADYYDKLIHPDREEQWSLRERLLRLNRLEVTVAYPFLLNVYADYSSGALSVEEFAQILDILENFILRRSVCNIPRSPLNKIFPLLYAQAAQAPDFIEGLRENLATKGYPTDAKFREDFVSSRMYAAGSRLDRTKLILERLELAEGSKEIVPFKNLTIEHVMPQTLTSWWKEHLGEHYEQVHELLLHTIGNLTLTGYNAELSNSDFQRKKDFYATSHVGLNGWFQHVKAWSEEAIRERAEFLADQALQIWPYFGKTQARSVGSTSGITGKTPVGLIIVGQSILVKTWRDVLQSTLQVISDRDEDGFLLLAEKYPHYISLDPAHLRTTRQLANGFYFETNISALNIDRFCRQAIDLVGLTAEDWILETT